jgi:hypothetical protein
MAAVFDGGGGQKVVEHVGEGDGELQGGRATRARESRRWIWRPRAAALASKQRRKGEGGMGKGRGCPVGLVLRGKEEGCRVRRACSSEGSGSRQLHASGGGGQRHGHHETGEAVPLISGPRYSCSWRGGGHVGRVARYLGLNRFKLVKPIQTQFKRF